MAAAPQGWITLALVGTGEELAKAVEAFNGLPTVEIVAVGDVQDRAAGAALAQGLGLVAAKSPTDVFKSKPDIVLSVGGDETRYERLPAVKPPGVEVMSAYGVRLLLSLLPRAP